MHGPSAPPPLSQRLLSLYEPIRLLPVHVCKLLLPRGRFGVQPLLQGDLTTLLILLSVRAAPSAPECLVTAFTCCFITSAGFVLSEDLSTLALRLEALTGLTISVAARTFVSAISYARASVLALTTCLTGIYMARPPSKINDLVV